MQILENCNRYKLQTFLLSEELFLICAKGFALDITTQMILCNFAAVFLFSIYVNFLKECCISCYVCKQTYLFFNYVLDHNTLIPLFQFSTEFNSLWRFDGKCTFNFYPSKSWLHYGEMLLIFTDRLINYMSGL